MLIVSNKENQSEKSQKEHPEAKERKIEGEKKGREGGRKEGRKKCWQDGATRPIKGIMKDLGIQVPENRIKSKGTV